MTKRNKIIGGSVAFIIIAFVATRAFLSNSGGGPETIAVKRGSVTEYVSETGKIVAVDDIDLFFETTGRVDKVFVKEGETVEEGQVLMQLDAGQLSIRRQNALASLASAQARYNKALSGATPEEIRIAEIAVENAESSLVSAKENLEDTKASNAVDLDNVYSDLVGDIESVYLKSSTAMQMMKNDVFNASGNIRYDILSSDASISSEATTAFQVASVAKERMDATILTIRIAKEGETIDMLAGAIIADGKTIRDASAKANTLMQNASPTTGLSQSDFDARSTLMKTVWVDTNSVVNTAESQRALVSSTKISNLSSENTARRKVTTAEGALRTAREHLEKLKAPLRDVDKAVYLASIASARANVRLFDKQIADTRLKAPVSGVVGSLDVSVGELVTTATRVASVISKVFRIESDVSELDIAKITEGQDVEITFDALEGRVFEGRVVSVAPRETTSIDSDIFYTVKISIDDAGASLRSGMTADLDINVGSATDTIIVPRRQVLRKGNANFMKVLKENGDVEEREVVVGLRGDDNYEILEGVSVGDRVIVE